MALDPSTLLTQVESAISALLTGGHTSYSIGTRSVTKLDLPQLFEERRMLLAEVDNAAGSSISMAKMVRTSR